MLAWYRKWKAERERKRHEAANRAFIAYLNHLQAHMDALSGVNSAMRGKAADDHATHVRLNAKLRAELGAATGSQQAHEVDTRRS